MIFPKHKPKIINPNYQMIIENYYCLTNSRQNQDTLFSAIRGELYKIPQVYPWYEHNQWGFPRTAWQWPRGRRPGRPSPWWCSATGRCWSQSGHGRASPDSSDPAEDPTWLRVLLSWLISSEAKRRSFWVKTSL